MAALMLLMAHACLSWSGSAAAQPITQYSAHYNFSTYVWFDSVPAAVNYMIALMESWGGTDCTSVYVAPDLYTTRKCTYLDHEEGGLRFRMRQVIDGRNGSQVLHSDNILGGTYETRGP
jgi:hypothetical protein